MPTLAFRDWISAFFFKKLMVHYYFRIPIKMMDCLKCILFKKSEL